MAIKQLSKSNIEGGVRKSKLWDDETYIGDFQWIAGYTVASTSVRSFTWTNIPQNFTHLQIRCNFRQDASWNLYVCFNHDSDNVTPSYNRHYTYHSGSTGGTATSGGDLKSYGAANFGWTPTTAAASFTSSGITDIMDYASTNKYKTTKNQNGSIFPNLSPATSAQAGLVLYEGVYQKTDAVKSITMHTDTKTVSLDIGSRFELYGWK